MAESDSTHARRQSVVKVLLPTQPACGLHSPGSIVPCSVQTDNQQTRRNPTVWLLSTGSLPHNAVSPALHPRSQYDMNNTSPAASQGGLKHSVTPLVTDTVPFRRAESRIYARRLLYRPKHTALTSRKERALAARTRPPTPSATKERNSSIRTHFGGTLSECGSR